MNSENSMSMDPSSTAKGSLVKRKKKKRKKKLKRMKSPEPTAFDGFTLKRNSTH